MPSKDGYSSRRRKTHAPPAPAASLYTYEHEQVFYHIYDSDAYKLFFAKPEPLPRDASKHGHDDAKPRLTDPVFHREGNFSRFQYCVRWAKFYSEGAPDAFTGVSVRERTMLKKFLEALKEISPLPHEWKWMLTVITERIPAPSTRGEWTAVKVDDSAYQAKLEAQQKKHCGQ